MAGDLRVVEFSDPNVEEDDGEVDLSLGLSIGGSSRKAARTSVPSQRSDSEMRSGEAAEVDLGRSGTSPPPPPQPFNQIDGGDTLDTRKPREVQAFRRQEARKKRDEKQQKKGICRGRNGVFTGAAAAEAPGFYGLVPPVRTCSLDDRMALKAQEFQSRLRDREAREEEDRTLDHAPNSDLDSNPNTNPNPSLSLNSDPSHARYGTHPFPVMPTQYPYHHVQYVPFANGFGLPYMMPCWAPNVSPVAAEGLNPERNVFQPVAYRTLQPFSPTVVEPNGIFPLSSNAAETNGGNGKASGIKRARFPLLRGSLGSSSSAVSDYQSGSLEGGSSSSSDTRSHSSHAVVEKTQPQISSQVSNPQGQSDHSISSHQIASATKVVEEPTDLNPTPCVPRKLEETVSVNKPISAAEKANPSENSPPLPQMPCVSTTGNGPNGKTITGFLYRYTKSEVSIVCVCHGSSFSPAEFVKHAGGTDISHPLRHIIVVPS